ncbi:hypothetical protein G7Y89_g3420 [Cudoniella acicularis]|uniref:Uncharacterized protein n=1 Tax=Cudoniella acicularis TaxID=354080 RepID=A0A8H4RRE8_9HELO|nr:hypothetical protein G7Y89_g3420 [Cudoniella acicularis]
MHFSRTGLFWECRHCEASEAFPENLPEFHLKSAFSRDRNPLSKHWLRIVELYTAAKLTFAKDKMAAISGIAQEAFEESEDQYLAGLWRDGIELQLLWTLYSPGGLPKGAQYQAPSWSWASVDPVYYPWDLRCEGIECVHYAHIVNAHTVVPEGQEPFGKLVGGKLQIRGITEEIPADTRPTHLQWWEWKATRKFSNSKARLVWNWLACTSIKTIRVDFTGAFTQRRIEDDWTVIPESEWLSRNALMPPVRSSLLAIPTQPLPARNPPIQICELADEESDIQDPDFPDIDMELAEFYSSRGEFDIEY